MNGSQSDLMSKIYNARAVQIRNKDKDAIVTYKILRNKKVIVFVTNYHENTLPL